MSNHTLGLLCLGAAAVLSTMAVMLWDPVVGLFVGAAIALTVGVLLVDFEALTDDE